MFSINTWPFIQRQSDLFCDRHVGFSSIGEEKMAAGWVLAVEYEQIKAVISILSEGRVERVHEGSSVGDTNQHLCT